MYILNINVVCEYFWVWGWVVRYESRVGLRVGKLTPIHILDPQRIHTTHPLIKKLTSRSILDL